MPAASPKKHSPAPVDPPPPASQAETPWIGKLGARAPWIAILLVLIATARIASTYAVFTHTVDEMFHIACGVEWWSKGTYRQETQHPPLSRILVGIGPWLSGARLMDQDRNLYDQGAYVLYSGMNYDKRLMLARLGVLPFFWLSCWVVFAWCKRYFDGAAAVAGVLIYSNIPAVLAHSSLATTDMALTATLPVALLALIAMIERPSTRSGIIFGIALALALLAKFSTLPFLPCALAVAAVAAWRTGARPGALRAAVVPAAVGIAVCFPIVWAFYRFSFGSAAMLGFSVPAPEFFSGIDVVRAHNAEGHNAFLLGEFSKDGFWYYYPVALFFKTPLALLALTAASAWIAWSKPELRYRIPLAAALGVLLFALSSRINIGVRHVLPLYVFASIAAAGFVRNCMRSFAGWLPKLALGCVGLLVAASAASHPDYLAFFNVMAGGEPERILVDSDLDWGQDMKRLGVRLGQLGAKQVALNPLVNGFWEEAHGFPKIVPLDPRAPRPGWNAVSLTMLTLTRIGTREKSPGMEIWTDRAKPVERVGRGMLLYYSESGK